MKIRVPYPRSGERIFMNIENLENLEAPVEKVKGCNYMLLLYPDNENHMKVLEKIQQSFDYACILHDKDKFTESDEKKNSEHKAGSFKKAHFHVVVRFPNKRWNTAVAKTFGLELRFVEKVHFLDKALMYLVHFGNEAKHQYSHDEVLGPLKKRMIEKINAETKEESEFILEILEFVKNYDGYLPYDEYLSFLVCNGYWNYFRRSAFPLTRLLDEHNQKYKYRNNE